MPRIFFCFVFLKQLLKQSDSTEIRSRHFSLLLSQILRTQVTVVLNEVTRAIIASLHFFGFCQLFTTVKTNFYI